MGSLRVISGPRAGEQIEVDRTLVFGRYETDVVIDDPELSRRHLQISPEGDVLIVEDLGSTNGTLVDDHPINAPTSVAHGARVKLGATLLEVQLVAEAQATQLRQRAVDPDATRIRSVPAEAAVPLAAASVASVSSPPTPATPAGDLIPQQFGAFRPPAIRRSGGLASRSWVPVALSYGSVIATAVALVIYFAQR